jgi:hypothetical protein
MGTMTPPDDRSAIRSGDLDELVLAVRAHTVRIEADTDLGTDAVAKRPKRRRRLADRSGDDSCTEILVLDCETTIDAAQALRFGVWAYYRLIEGSWVCVEEGVFYNDDLPTAAPDDFGVLKGYVGTHYQDTGDGRRRRLRLLSRQDFVVRVFLRAAYDGDARVVGFNLPFDLSRLAVRSTEGRGRNRGGFSLVMAHGNAAKGYTEHKHRPRLRVKTVNAHRADITFGKPMDAGPTHWSGDFVDTRTLVHALTGTGHSLDSACAAFGVEGKSDSGGHGDPLTGQYIDYCRRDVAATAGLYQAAAGELAALGLPLTPPQVHSAASLAKAMLGGFGVDPILRRMPDLDVAVLGQAMSAFYGGRAECHIRKVAVPAPVPVRLVDFTATYPTLFTLLDLWPIVTAQTLHTPEVTDEARELLDAVTIEAGFDPALWPRLNGYALVAPDDDILPVRARYVEGKPGYGIGMNHLTSTGPLWYPLPTVVASALLKGRPPKIIKAFRVVPQGQIDTLRPLVLPGGHRLDPRVENPFQVLVEQRERIRNDPTLAPGVREHLQRGLKVMANSGAYGIWAEYNSDPLPVGKTADVTVHGRAEQPFDTTVTAPEDPGKYCFPPLAGIITGGAHLFLALLERCVTEAGGTWAMADTDSMAIVASEQGGLIACPGGPERTDDGQEAVRVLTYDQVETIRERFVALNPYDHQVVPGSILKHETDAWCYAIAAKRYALFRYDNDGMPRLIPSQEHAPCSHGLGHLLNPYAHDKDVPADRWVVELWEYTLAHALTKHRPAPPQWFDQPALSRISATSPALLGPFGAVNAGWPYDGQVKPFNFLTYAPGAQPPADVPAGARYRLVAPYATDPGQWRRLRWVNLHDPRSAQRVSIDPSEPCTATLTTYGQIAARYVTHREAKALGPDGQVCQRDTVGLLARRHVVAGCVMHVGKEANRITDRQTGLLNLDDVEQRQVTYSEPRSDVLSWPEVVEALRAEPLEGVADMAGISPRRLRDLLAGKSNPRDATLRRLADLAQGLTSPLRAS